MQCARAVQVILAAFAAGRPVSRGCGKQANVAQIDLESKPEYQAEFGASLPVGGSECSSECT